MLNTLSAILELLYIYRKKTIMGQFADYFTPYLPAKKSPKQNKDGKISADISPSKNHVTFADSSFSFGHHENEKVARMASISFSNQRTINTYIAISFVAFLSHIIWVIYPKYSSTEFDYTDVHNYQLLSLSCITPFVIYFASFGAMNQVCKPLAEGAKLNTKNAGLDLNNNPFITSIKIIVALTALCQISSIWLANFYWVILLIIPIWCFKLTSKIAQTEYERYSVNSKRPWVPKLGLSKSPKGKSLAKETTPRIIPRILSPKKSEPEIQATPRTRTRRAVKNLISGVSDRYHAFEQNVAQQISQKIFNPLSPKAKMIADN